MKIAITGDADASIWRMTSRERIARMAQPRGIEITDDAASADLVADARFAFDPLWLDHLVAHPGLSATCGGTPFLSHRGDAPATIAAETAQLYNPALRKTERPFAMPLTPATRDAAERAAYDAAYKGATDVLTAYVWRGLAFHLVRLAAWIGLTPNMVTAIGLPFCIAAALLFAHGWYLAGIAAGLVFMVLDTVDGKLARCTITSSQFGNAFDHGIDLIHPPFWWWAWLAGLAAYGTPLPEAVGMGALGLILVAYMLQRSIEGGFIAQFGIHVHVWRRFDTWFRLITARRNPNIALLLPFAAVGRPDWGFLALAAWCVVSLVVHLVQLGQALIARARGRPVTSWLDQAASP